MLAGVNNSLSKDKGIGKGDEGKGKGARTDAVGKMAASAFNSIVKKNDKDEDEDESKGLVLDQRRINEIFVRLRVAEISALNFAALGILCGIFDYEVAYNDNNDNERTIRIIFECFCV
jgi:hypothetical protein